MALTHQLEKHTYRADFWLSKPTVSLFNKNIINSLHLRSSNTHAKTTILSALNHFSTNNSYSGSYFKLLLFLFLPLLTVQLMYTLLQDFIHAHTHIFTWKKVTDFHNSTVMKPELLIFIFLPLELFIFILIRLRFSYLESLILVVLRFLTIGNFFVCSSLLLPKLFGNRVREPTTVKKQQQMKRFKKRNQNKNPKTNKKSKWFSFFLLPLFFFFFYETRYLVSRLLHYAAGYHRMPISGS